MNTITSTFRFTPKAISRKNAIVLIYDLEGFSRFFNQADVQEYVPAFLNKISGALSQIFFGGLIDWVKEKPKISPLALRVVHEKFMGDGGLYILLPPDGEIDFNPDVVRAFLNRLWNLKNNFNRILEAMRNEVPVAEIPQRIRFGLARGTIFELEGSAELNREYIGFPINLASRLQKYCPAVGFLASARLGIPENELESHGYTKVVATSIPGFSKEIVIVDKDGYEKLNQEVRDSLFAPLNSIIEM